MEIEQRITEFFMGIGKDARISISHIGLYAALLRSWQLNQCRQPLEIYSHEVMCLAKISSCTTYHKCIRDLHAFGYLRYEPSYKRNQRSKIYLV